MKERESEKERERKRERERNKGEKGGNREAARMELKGLRGKPIKV